MPSPSYVGDLLGADVTIGAGADETGILIGDMDWSLDNPKVPYFDRYGATTGYATDHDANFSLTITGEVSVKTTGINVATFTAAATLANEDFFANAGSAYHGINFALGGAARDTSCDTVLDQVSGSQPRGGARTITAVYMRRIGITTI